MMKFRELTKEESRQAFDKLEDNINNEIYYDELDEDYKKIRKDLLGFVKDGVFRTYDCDLEFAIKLYNYFSENNIDGFNETVASNYGFWRYMCIKVVPDIIYKRHGFVSEYFYTKNVRMYLPTMWWYIHIANQGDNNKTYNVLKRYNTDYIMQFVERPGKDGMYLDVIRTIFKYLYMCPQDVVNKTIDNKNLCRRLMIQNTAKMNNFNLVFENKIDKYVIELFDSCGVDVKNYLSKGE